MPSGSIDPRILKLGTRWRWVVSFTPRTLYTRGKSCRYQLDRRLGGSQSRSGQSDEKKYFPLLCRESNLDHLNRNLVTILTELLRPLQSCRIYIIMEVSTCSDLRIEALAHHESEPQLLDTGVTVFNKKPQSDTHCRPRRSATRERVHKSFNWGGEGDKRSGDCGELLKWHGAGLHLNSLTSRWSCLAEVHQFPSIQWRYLL
jgi:hypothetical protein